MLKQWLKKVLGRRDPWEYRKFLLDDFIRVSGNRSPQRILEIGPRDGMDTRGLLALNPEKLVLVDLPNEEAQIKEWLKEMNSPRIQHITANIMYTSELQDMDPFDLVWCTGVLYHNPEQLRMIRRLYDLLKPEGYLVLESATTRQRVFASRNCVEIIYPPSDAYKRRYHLSANITHLPSAQAIESWLRMIGFQPVVRSNCHRRISRSLSRSRAAFVAQRPLQSVEGRYLTLHAKDGFLVGKAL